MELPDKNQVLFIVGTTAQTVPGLNLLKTIKILEHHGSDTSCTLQVFRANEITNANAEPLFTIRAGNASHVGEHYGYFGLRDQHGFAIKFSSTPPTTGIPKAMVIYG